MSYNPFAEVEDELPVASLVDNMYRIVRLIGRGGMGAVYEAEDIRLGRSVALKVLRSDLARQLQADERFMQEARILARIRSPFVCTVYSIGATEGGKTYIAMEYIDGGSLGDLLDRERWLPLNRAIRIAQRVCEALIEAHEVGIIHRDLKPDNILLTRLGSIEDYVKVVDLGLAKHIASAGSSNNPRLTQARLVLGTPAYMSPEQAAGHDVGPPSDLYSLGVIFYEMLTGYLPVDGETPQDFLRAHQLQAPVPLSQRRPDLSFPPEVEAVCQRILTKQADERPEGARDFIELLEELEQIRLETERPPSRAVRRSSRSAMPRPKAPQASPKAVAPTLATLDERLERAKDRVRLELVGMASTSRAALYETFDAYGRHAGGRVDAPVVVRMRIPPPEGRVPLACMFEEVRARAGLSDDDPPALCRRKLLSWAQGLMPERPGRASQIAHLAGMFLDVDFPDSPHLSHARAVPEVARMAGGTALADVLRALAGRGALVLLLERVGFLTESEHGFLRRLVRQLGATPVLVAAGWVGNADDVPSGLGGMVTGGSVLTVPSKTPDVDVALGTGAEEVLRTAVQLGMPVWTGMLEAALDRPVRDDLNRLVAAGALRSTGASRFTGQDEFVFGDFAQDMYESADHTQVDLTAALTWLADRARERPRLWAQRLAQLETQAGALVEAAGHARVAGAAMFDIGALTEAVDAFEMARAICLDLKERDGDGAAIGLALTAQGIVRCLEAQGDDERMSERAHEAIELLRELSTLDEQAWYELGAPLLSAWSGAETRLGRGADALAPLSQQIDAISASRLDIAVARLPELRRAMGDALRATGDVRRALEQWLAALRDLPIEPDFQVMADLSMRISDAYREVGDGDRAVHHARKALASARLARDLVRESEGLRTLAVALRDIGELDDAEAQLGEALNALGRVDRPGLAAEVSVLLARVLMQRGASEEADAALAKACRSFAALTDLSGLADALRQRGEIQMAQGIYTRGLAFAEESARQAVLAGEVPLQVRALLLAARAAAATGDYGHSHSALESAFQLVAPGAATAERAECLVTLGDLLEADVLTSDRPMDDLLTEAADIYEAAGATTEAATVRRRLRAMTK